MDRKHVETPWSVVGGSVYGGFGGMDHVATVHGLGPSSRPAENEAHDAILKANATIIVQAVNERPALLARCAELERALGDMVAADDAHWPLADAARVRAAARAALSGGGKVGA